MESGERLLEVVLGDLVFVDVEAVEDRLVEQAALFVVTAEVQLLWVLQQLQADFDQAGALREVLAGLLEPFLEVLALALDGAELRLDLGLRQGAVGRQLKEILFTCVQRL
ncbi:hypothetical protein [Streptomyces sp. NPDC001758]